MSHQTERKMTLDAPVFTNSTEGEGASMIMVSIAVLLRDQRRLVSPPPFEFFAKIGWVAFKVVLQLNYIPLQEFIFYFFILVGNALLYLFLPNLDLLHLLGPRTSANNFPGHSISY